MPTPEEIKKLKSDWASDPIWDIEDTEGFGEHKYELLAFRKEQEAKWSAEHDRILREYGAKHGLDNNLKLAEHIRNLEQRLEKLDALVRA